MILDQIAHFFEHYKDLEKANGLRLMVGEMPMFTKQEILDSITNLKAIGKTTLLTLFMDPPFRSCPALLHGRLYQRFTVQARLRMLESILPFIDELSEESGITKAQIDVTWLWVEVGCFHWSSHWCNRMLRLGISLGIASCQLSNLICIYTYT